MALSEKDLQQLAAKGITVEKLTINAQNADVTQVANAF